MNTQIAPWYDHRRVATKSSVVLGKWLQQRPGGIDRAGLTPVRRIEPPHQRNYAAAQVNRLTQGWSTVSASANSDIHRSLDAVRARSRTTVTPSRRASAATRLQASVAYTPVAWSKVATAAIRSGAQRAIACSSAMESRPPDTASTSCPGTAASANSTR